MAQGPGKFGVLFVRARREPAVWESVLEGLRESIRDQLLEVDSIAKASDHVQLGWNGIIYLSLDSKEDLLQVANFLLHHQFEIKTEKTVRVGIFSALTHAQVSEFLLKSGATEVLDFETNQKTVFHKISVHLKLIEKATLGGETQGIEFDKVLKGNLEKSSNLRHISERSNLTTPLRTKSSSSPEKGPGWKTGASAMQKQGAFPKWEGKAIEIVDQVSERSLTIDVPKSDWKIGEKFSLDFETLNLEMAPLLKMNGVIESLLPHELNDRAMLSIKLDPESAKLYEEIQNKLDELQDGILQFMKEAKG